MSQTSFDELVKDPAFFPDWSSQPTSQTKSRRTSAIVDQDPESHLPGVSDAGSHILFFYGTLTLPHVLTRVLSLLETPILQQATIVGYVMKMWGPYPALIPLNDSEAQTRGHTRIEGKAFQVSEKQLHLLTSYEGENYTLAPVTIFTGHIANSGYTYVWAGYFEDLTEGVFDASRFPNF